MHDMLSSFSTLLLQHGVGSGDWFAGCSLRNSQYQFLCRAVAKPLLSVAVPATHYLPMGEEEEEEEEEEDYGALIYKNDLWQHIIIISWFLPS